MIDALKDSSNQPFADFERRFGGLRRLYGSAGAQAIFNTHAIVVGIGGVGSWAAEALARSGVGAITLIDMDHVSESNINRQIHALGPTVGQSKIVAMSERIFGINPYCHVHLVDDFVKSENLSEIMTKLPVDGHRTMVLLDACDQVRAKTALATWAVEHRCHFITVGAAGGKRKAHAVEVADLSDVTHDPLLAQLRYRLRKHHAASKNSSMGVNAVFSREAVAPPDASCQMDESVAVSDGSLNCHGYGSVVTVTATFGLVAAGFLLDKIAKSASSGKVVKNMTII